MKILSALLLNGTRLSLLLLMIIMVISVSWGVFARYILQTSAPWTGELAAYTLVWLTFLGSAHAVFEKTHIRFETLIELFPRPVQLTINACFNALIILFFALIMIYGIEVTAKTMSDQSMTLPITKGVIYGILPVCSILIIIGLLTETIQSFRGGKQ
ncbi:TRAP transporter small permease [Halalkalibacter oceani]|uniref:TRAP transporter small permease n=1 Tax=Halalkalibacter oceani TaxID=1653776 RepID=A0A9X2DQV1_9BACI|nr:TRAP transporter small permease [Halalkalibacter oceani]MCM3714783.1 TRAP transporter small permease [Halalkalibacter oceani]